MSAVGPFLLAVFVWLLWIWAVVIVGTLLLVVWFWLIDRLPSAPPSVAPRPLSVDEVAWLDDLWESPCAPDPRRLA